ncbi:hypothetical protein JOE48_003392 [Methylobacterium sp. PvR107]|nr:hypothetical protein [Methylobacterium sp. PvR107]
MPGKHLVANHTRFSGRGVGLWRALQMQRAIGRENECTDVISKCVHRMASRLAQNDYAIYPASTP